jgi:hypothetical protein
MPFYATLYRRYVHKHTQLSLNSELRELIFIRNGIQSGTRQPYTSSVNAYTRGEKRKDIKERERKVLALFSLPCNILCIFQGEFALVAAVRRGRERDSCGAVKNPHGVCE